LVYALEGTESQLQLSLNLLSSPTDSIQVTKNITIRYASTHEMAELSV
jgi:hypothetical protein